MPGGVCLEAIRQLVRAATSTRPSRRHRSARSREGRPNQAYPDFPDDPRLPDLLPQRAYFDLPTSETTNDICIRWNAPLVWVATFLSLARD